MKHPTPSDFTVDLSEARVSVVFKPSDSHYSFGRLADPDDIARYGPLSRSPSVRHGATGDTGDYPPVPAICRAKRPAAPQGPAGLRLHAVSTTGWPQAN
jgi:hypothetical protein